MLPLFASLGGLLKKRATCTDGPVFRLHSRWTVLFLLAASLLLSCRQHFGDPIHCIQSRQIRLRALETFCWIHATFILPDAWHKEVGSHVPHPGIDRYTENQARVYHAYYQWVALTLLLQAVLFYLPRYLWKAWENGRIKAFTLNLDDPLLDTDSRDESVALLVHAIRLNWGHHSGYVRHYVACEIMSLVNVIGQMYLIDTFLGGEFTTYGLQVLKWSEWDQEHRTDPMVSVFPRITKCLFHDFGSSGDVQKNDALCLLPLNILNEKIYIFLWFWMLGLAALTAFTLLYRAALAAVPLLRYCVLLPRSQHVNKGALERILQRANFGDWFVLYMLTKNLEPQHFKVVVGRLVTDMEQNGHAKRDSDNLTYV